MQLYLLSRVYWVATTPNAGASPNPHVYDCGNTTAEASERDCNFEFFTVSWVPPECADQELDGEFRAMDWET